MIEYEYSFKVEDIEPYLTYCAKNGFNKISIEGQIRKLYINSNNILARLTTKIVGDMEEIILDFKDENDSNSILKESRETIPLIVTVNNQQAVESILNILNYRLSKTLKRDRTVYEKDDVKFEIDEYTEPEKCFIVAIEGFKESVDKVYIDLKKIIINEENK